MPNMNAGRTYSFCIHYQTKKQIVFKRWTTVQLYAQTIFHGQLKMTVNKKAAISPVAEVGFENVFYGQMLNYLDKLKMTGWNSLYLTCKNE